MHVVGEAEESAKKEELKAKADELFYSMVMDRTPNHLVSETEDDFWSSENCWERLYNRVQLTKMLLESDLTKGFLLYLPPSTIQRYEVLGHQLQNHGNYL